MMECFSQRLIGLLLGGLLASSPLAAGDLTPRDLSGQWRFALDRGNVGIKEQWFCRTLSDRLTLPGTLQRQGFGDPVAVDSKLTGDSGRKKWQTAPQYAEYRRPGNIKFPFMLQPERLYAGAAWYQRDIEVPADWQGRRVVLTLERPHWETTVWIDGRPVGRNEGLSTAHVYDLGTELTPGRHSLTVRVDNRLIVNVGNMSHSVTDHTAGNWNGIIGRIELSSTSPVWIDDVRVYPNAREKTALVRVFIGNATGKSGQGVLKAGDVSVPVTWGAKSEVPDPLVARHAGDAFGSVIPTRQDGWGGSVRPGGSGVGQCGVCRGIHGKSRQDQRFGVASPSRIRPPIACVRDGGSGSLGQ